VWIVDQSSWGLRQDAWYLPHKKADWIKVKSNIKIHSNNLPPEVKVHVYVYSGGWSHAAHICVRWVVSGEW